MGTFDTLATIIECRSLISPSGGSVVALFHHRLPHTKPHRHTNTNTHTSTNLSIERPRIYAAFSPCNMNFEKRTTSPAVGTPTLLDIKCAPHIWNSISHHRFDSTLLFNIALAQVFHRCWLAKQNPLPKTSFHLASSHCPPPHFATITPPPYPPPPSPTHWHILFVCSISLLHHTHGAVEWTMTAFCLLAVRNMYNGLLLGQARSSSLFIYRISCCLSHVR